MPNTPESVNILTLRLDEEKAALLDKLKNEFDEKTFSKTIIEACFRYEKVKKELEDLKEKYTASQAQIIDLEEKLKAIKAGFKALNMI